MQFKAEQQEKTKVVFLNQPRLSPREVEQELNNRRLGLVPHIENFVVTHSRFKGREVSVEFIPHGGSSLISILETTEEKVVLKISLHSLRESEVVFLKKWEEFGVKVPHVFEAGEMGGRPYFLMEYIDAPILRNAYSSKEMTEQRIYLEMGQTLRAMHKPKASGYGRLVNGQPEFATFENFLQSKNVQKKITYVSENAILGEEHGSPSVATDILLKHNENRAPSYCHEDFGSQNIFATHPITVFDPDPRLNDGYMDLGRTLVLHIAKGGEAMQQFFDGYFEKEIYDKRALHAAILMNAYWKFDYWNKTERFEEIKNVKEYLKANKYLLEK